MAVSLRLKDGYQVSEGSLTAVKMNLDQLKERHLAALIDLVKKCQDPSHEFLPTPFGDSSEILRDYALLNNDDEIIHEDVRRIVLNSIEGSGQKLKLVSPLDKNRVTS
jgi:hypothetical protein